jgi:hypothetical protein
MRADSGSVLLAFNWMSFDPVMKESREVAEGLFSDGMDPSLDAVWESAVSVNQQGWTEEI